MLAEHHTEGNNGQRQTFSVEASGTCAPFFPLSLLPSRSLSSYVLQFNGYTMSSAIIFWIWVFSFVPELVVALPKALRVCLEANEFRKLLRLCSGLHTKHGPQVFSILGLGIQYQALHVLCYVSKILRNAYKLPIRPFYQQSNDQRSWWMLISQRISDRFTTQ